MKKLTIVVCFFACFLTVQTATGQDSLDAINYDDVQTATEAADLPTDAVTYKVVASDKPDNTVTLVQVPDPAGLLERIWEWVQKNGAAGLSIFISLLGLVEVVVRLTPSKKDDAAFQWLRKVMDFIVPNFKAGGGKFPTPKA